MKWCSQNTQTQNKPKNALRQKLLTKFWIWIFFVKDQIFWKLEGHEQQIMKIDNSKIWTKISVI